jgi:hypothetical protein
MSSWSRLMNPSRKAISSRHATFIPCRVSSVRAGPALHGPQAPKPVRPCPERLHEEFKRRIKTQTVLPSADTAAMLFGALLVSGQINMRKVDGWQTLATKPIDQPIELAA